MVCDGSGTMSDQLLTVKDFATLLQCSEDAVVRRFAKMPGVIDLGKSETRSRRRYRVLRIPKAVVEKYLTSKSGRSVPGESRTKTEVSEMGRACDSESCQSCFAERSTRPRDILTHRRTGKTSD